MIDRRHDSRYMLTRPVKIQCAITGRYIRGRTCNVSPGGALLELDHPSLLVRGQRLRVAVAWNDRQALVRSSDMTEAQVVRSLGLGGGQHVAVHFDQLQQIEMAATA